MLIADNDSMLGKLVGKIAEVCGRHCLKVNVGRSKVMEEEREE